MVPARETYSKGTQTTLSLVQAASIDAAHAAADALIDSAAAAAAATVSAVATPSDASSGLANNGAATSAAVARPQYRADDSHGVAVVKSDEFATFVATVLPAVERALRLNQRFDFMADFAGKLGGGASDRGGGSALRARAPFFDERWCRKRAVMALDWSRAQPALLAAAMTAPEVVSSGGILDADGVVCVWSAGNLLERPEFVFTCSSQVTAVAFANFQPTLLVGGTYSGQIVLWDSRAGSAPVQRALVSATGHTHPVYSVSLVGTAAAHNLVTVSTDGRMCVWTLENLTEPIETLELISPASSATAPSTPMPAGIASTLHGTPGTPGTPGASSTAAALDTPTTPRDSSAGGVPATPRAATALVGSGISLPVGATVLRFQYGETNAFLCGAESGDVWRGFRHGAHSGLHERFSGHSAPITGLDWHPKIATAGGGGGSSSMPLFLTSSADWTVRLWHAKHTGAGALRVFETSRDFVCDVQWSPAHPALFATVDGSGELAVWNINRSLEEPVAHFTVDAQHALHKVAWHADGRIVAAGDAVGRLHLFDVADDIAVPASDEFERLERTIKSLLLDQNAR